MWSQGISADILYDSMEMDTIEDVQEFCRTYYIPHIVVLSDKKLFFERKQVYYTVCVIFQCMGILYYDCMVCMFYEVNCITLNNVTVLYFRIKF